MILAPAKVNLGLEITGRRPDGYHDIVSLVQTVDLYDDVDVTPGDRLTVQMTPPLVSAGDNLALQAARLLAERFRPNGTAEIVVAKRIPLAAGLGGGSADAAATLLALRDHWGLPVCDSTLETLAAELGSDVPLFIRAGTSLITGRGERVRPILATPVTWLLIVVPHLELPDKTRRLYQELRPRDMTDGDRTLKLAAALAERGAVTASMMVNGFDAAAARVYPGFAALRARLEQRIGTRLHLSGAGPSLFALFDSPASATAAATRLRRHGVDTFVAAPTRSRASPVREESDRPSAFARLLGVQQLSVTTHKARNEPTWIAPAATKATTGWTVHFLGWEGPGPDPIIRVSESELAAARRLAHAELGIWLGPSGAAACAATILAAREGTLGSASQILIRDNPESPTGNSE
ncbi:MAG: 4-(cytidine 5'-diphospho)-2-C-methyl-D-erythritol kinase [Chloroflexota bacterium]